MIQLTMCGSCRTPVVDQPYEKWTNAASTGQSRLRHVADDTPICRNAHGRPAEVVFIEDAMPADPAASPWLAAMSELFALDGPYDPGRMASAVDAAEHLHHWLRIVTGPASAPVALVNPSATAFLIGHVYRTSQLLAQVQAQAGDHAVEYVRHRGFTGDTSTQVSPDSINAARRLRVLLFDAADLTFESARHSGAAWAHVREMAAGTDDANRPRPASGRITHDAPDTAPLSAAHLAEQIGRAFADEATFSPEQTRDACRAIGTLASYLANCLGAARTAAIASSGDLAAVATSLTYLTHTLHGGLKRLADSPPGSESDGLGDTAAHDMRALLHDAAEYLLSATARLAALANIAGDPGTDPEPPW
ncbi:hypothetical protein [Micromonospora sp. WMMD1082]|uniref:hypothetical protein n=1 Tax=Micromonospora sp. WMMD1082 TaxID=3016104 RepID=UPI0024163531|nr:hypothetical protein [Micromonospora sp. WMMD1082]MDG4795050.1 hypothetical protein [Micromonospora sp. WMMD1082]